MGITGLLPFVKNSCRSANVKDFVGATVAIDAYSWLHKGAFACAEKLVKGEKTDGYVFYCIKLLNMLIDAGVTPIMVFDGCNLASKAVTEKKRRENREKTRQRGKELLCEGKVKEARECFQRCVDVTPEMAKEVIEACRKKSIDCIVAPYEADAQLAYLDKAGIADLIITEDSDLILFGCSKILFKMDNCGGGFLYEKENLPKSFGANASKFSFEKFRYMCILSGCDYLPSLPGIGLAKAYKFFTLTSITDISVALTKLPSYLKMPKLVVSDDYKESFIKANNTFLYQLAFCPKEKRLVPLNPYTEGVTADDMDYAGIYLDNDLAYQLAMGNINVKTLKEFDSFDYPDSLSLNEDTSLIWGSATNKKSSNTSSKKETAFKFSTPTASRKTDSNSKRKVIDLEEPETSANYAKDLFSQYCLTNNKKQKCNDSYEEEPILPCSSSSDYSSDHHPNSSISSTPDEPVFECSPIKLKHPVKKMVKSRFFHSSSSPSSIDSSVSNFTSASSGFLSKTEDFLSNSEVSEYSDFIPTPNVEEKAKSECEEANKQNFGDKENLLNRFAKKKTIEVEHKSPNTVHNPISSTPKQESVSLLDILSSESSSTTLTLSSNQKAVKILSKASDDVVKARPKSLFAKKDSCKKLTETKIEDFKWTKESPQKQSANSSLCDNSDTTEQCNVSKSPLKELSPYFLNTSSNSDSLHSENIETVTITSDCEDSDLSEAKSCSSKPSENKCLKKSSSTNGKSKCRSVGLSKKRRSTGALPNTLLSFNFTKLPADVKAS